MNAEYAFLEDILDNPDDDTPRLVYADWLLDRGGRGDEARAKFIRTQCQDFRRPERDTTYSWHEFWVQRTLRRFEERWLPADWRSPDQGRWQRGFFCVQTRLWPFLTQAEQWFGFPAVLDATVDIRGSGDGGILNVDEEHILFLGGTELLARVTRLNIRGRPHPSRYDQGDDIAKAVAASPHARRLRQLELSCLSDVGAWALLQSPHLRSLKEITMWAYVALSAAVRARLAERFLVVWQ